MKTSPITSDLGVLENKFKDHIKAQFSEVIKKRRITTEKTWRHATEAVEADYRSKLDGLLDRLEDLYEEIGKWPSETEDE